jgi:nucleotide-binding universal stress UspA family protein
MQFLVPVDGSPHSAAALEFVASRALLPGVDPDVRLLNVQLPIPPRAARAAGKEMVTSYHRAEADAVLQPALARLARAGIPARARHVIGGPGATVGAVAARSHADLVVMGSHGRTAFKGLLFGSVTQAVLAACTKPLLVVRDGYVPPSDSLRVAIAVDGSKFGLAAVRFVLTHRTLFGSEPRFRLLHAVQGATPKALFDRALAPALRLFGAAGVAVEPARLVGKNAGDAIAAEVARCGDDLLVMGSHGHGALATLLLGSVATRVAARCTTPLLLIRHKAPRRTSRR